MNSPQTEKWTQKDGWCKVCKDYTEAHLNTSRTKRWDLGMNYLHVQKNLMTNAQLKHAQLIPSNYAIQLFHAVSIGPGSSRAPNLRACCS